jgi:Na+/melibiose symporter-like transporter
MLPQVLAGLGALSILSAGCVLWLQRFQPVFAALAVAALAYQGWLVSRRPAYRRTRTMLWILWTSAGTTIVVFAVWTALWLRYR